MLQIESTTFGGEEGNVIVDAVEEEWLPMDPVPYLDCLTINQSPSNFEHLFLERFTCNSRVPPFRCTH